MKWEGSEPKDSERNVHSFFLIYSHLKKKTFDNSGFSAAGDFNFCIGVTPLRDSPTREGREGGGAGR